MDQTIKPMNAQYGDLVKDYEIMRDRLLKIMEELDAYKTSGKIPYTPSLPIPPEPPKFPPIDPLGGSNPHMKVLNQDLIQVYKLE